MTCAEVRELAAPFVLGALEPDEDRKVRAHLETCPEAHQEFLELGGVVPYLLDTVEQVEPPPGLRARVLAAAAADVAARPRAGLVAPLPTPPLPAATEPAEPTAAAREAPHDAAPIVAFPAEGEREARRTRRGSSLAWVARIAAALLIVVLGAWNVMLQGQLDRTRTYEESVTAVLELAAQSGSRTAVLSSPDGATALGIAAVGADGEIVMAMRDLSPTSGDEVYEAWVIADSDPEPIGSFRVGPSGTGVLTAFAPTVEEGITLALTREPAPGATTPTLPIVSLGVAAEPAS